MTTTIGARPDLADRETKASCQVRRDCLISVGLICVIIGGHVLWRLLAR